MKRLVVKVGSSTLSQSNGKLDCSYVSRLAETLAALQQAGTQVSLVTSGAVVTGAERLGIERLQTMPQKQAAAAVGQGILMGVYATSFEKCGLTAAQILLTRQDVADRTRYTNARNTFQKLFQYGAIPVVNENDSVAVEELRFGDNDTLTAMVALIIDADLAIILSDVDGLYDPADDARRTIPVVAEMSPAVESLARASGSAVGTGGMVTKLAAARIMTRSGIPLVIASGRSPDTITAAVERWRGYAAGNHDRTDPGTLFLPVPNRLKGRKRWIAFGSRARGSLHINDRARGALQDGGGSLLAPGIVSTAGAFQAGDLVRILDTEGTEIGRGLVSFSREEITLITGHRSDQIAGILGRAVLPEVVHRDNLVLSSSESSSESGSGAFDSTVS